MRSRHTDDGARLDALLAACAAAAPRGAHLVEGPIAATLHLLDGRIVHAEALEVPGLGSRLVAAGRLSGAQWGQVREHATRSRTSVSDVLLRRDLVTAAELDRWICDIVVDVLFCLMITSGPGAALSSRPTPWRHNWMGTVRGLEVQAAVAQAALRVERAVDLELDLLDVPTSRGAPPTQAFVLTADEWRLVWEVDGRRSIRDLAWSVGLSVADALTAVGGLRRSGLCLIATEPRTARADRAPGGVVPGMVVEASGSTVSSLPARRSAPSTAAAAPVAADAPVAAVAPDAPVPASQEPRAPQEPASLPRRRAQARRWDLGPVTPGAWSEQVRSADLAPVDAQLLRRVLDRLEDDADG